MSLRHLQPGERLETARDAAVVAIPLYGAHDLFVRCLRSVLGHTPSDVTVLIADDHGPDGASAGWVAELDARGALEHDVVWLRQPANLGFVGNCNAAFAAAAPADVVLVNSDVVVAEAWLEGLRDAARSDTLIATATALTNNGTILSVPYRNRPTPALPQNLTIDDAARRVRERSPRLRPRIPTAIGHCVYVRRAALELVGGFDDAFAPAYGEEVDFSQRCIARGLQHVAADDVLVLHHGRASLGVAGARNPIQAQHEELLQARYPYYAGWVEDVEGDEHGPLSRTLAVAGRALLGLNVTIDGRCLTGTYTGTQVLALELIHALQRTGEVRLRVLLPEFPGDYAVQALTRLHDVQLISVGHLGGDLPRDHVVHRPFQLTDPDELSDLASLAHRIVVTQQDLIAYRTPAYFAGSKAWLRYRAVTREALALADRVVFSSPHAADDALADALVPGARVAVVPIGTDHTLAPNRPPPLRPGLLDAHADEPFLLCLGTDFRHKNRAFALALLAALRERHQWPGRLVLAGANVIHGSSGGDEAEWLSLHRELAGAVTVLAAASEAEKAWLYSNCAAVVYPTTYEGFGFLPFEAAEAGRPCFFAHQASLADTLGDATAVLVAWDAAASADRAIGALTDEAEAQRLVAEVRDAARQLTWDATAAVLLAQYDEALAGPPRDASRLEGDRLVLDARYWTLRTQIGDTGYSLVGPEKPLLPQEAQRTLAALARRPATRRPLLGTLQAVRRLAVGRRARANGAVARDEDEEDGKDERDV